MQLYNHIKSVLEQNEDFYKDGKIFKNKVVEAALKLDPTILSLLLKDETAKKTFFQEVEEVLVFDKIKFQKFVSNKEFLPDSFTAFKNKIGLTANGEYLTEAKEVVLDFPFKDCVLEGGQTKEDQKRQEIFWNETLAPDEIDRMFEPKVFNNWKRYSSSKDNSIKTIQDDDNFIIKGNNLLVLHSLKKRYKGKINLIYIDPPYNTGSDSFGYNDTFNQSSWLTFMKNRLEIAKELLSPNGVILVQCSFHQFAFLKILMLDIFPKHLCDFNVQVRHPDRSLTGDKEYNDVIEYILIFSKNKNRKMPYKEEVKNEDDYTLQVKIKDGEQPFKILECDKKSVEVYLPEQYEVVSSTPAIENLKKISIRGSIREKNSSGRFFVKHLEMLSDLPAETLFKVPDMGDDQQGFRFFYSAPQNRKNGGYFQGMPMSSNVTKKQYSNFYNFEKDYNNVSRQGGVLFRNGKKPEELLKFLIEIFTDENDIVLDYHLGSGTTCATAHKLSRQYIGIEQMDYIETLAVNRMKQVIHGEQEGISKLIDWKGGGDFVYCELAALNEVLIVQINEAKNNDELVVIYKQLISSNAYLYLVNTKCLNDLVNEFQELSFLDKKVVLVNLIDQNNLYINLSEIDSSEYDISPSDKKLNNLFYENTYSNSL